MHLIQILLPLHDPEGEAFPRHFYTRLRTELTERFGGITAYSRAPATGLWKENEDKTVRDEILIYEVLAPALDRGWWRALKGRLEREFQQDEVLIRTWPVEVL